MYLRGNGRIEVSEEENQLKEEIFVGFLKHND